MTAVIKHETPDVSLPSIRIRTKTKSHKNVFLSVGDTKSSTKKIAVTSARAPPDESPLRRLSRTTTAPSSLISSNEKRQKHALDDSQPRKHRRTSTGKLYDDMIDTLEVETLCCRLGMTKQNIWELRKQFNDEDADGTDTITLAAFFFLINEKQHNLTKTILRLANVPLTQQRLTFDEYLSCVCTFSSFTQAELLKFFYQVYAEGQLSGATMEKGIQQLGHEIQTLRSAYSKNTSVATQHLAANCQEAALTFADFEQLSKQHMIAFYPLIQLQRSVREGTLGEAYWITKTREKQQIQRLLHYMAKHHGRQPMLPWKDLVMKVLFGRTTSMMRVHAQARNVYVNGMQ